MSRNRLVASARTVFSSKGFAATSLRDIAEAAGIKAPSIYAHFTSKQELFETVYAEIAVEHTSYFVLLAEDSRALPPLDRIRHLLDGVDAFYREEPEAAAFSLHAAAEEQSPELPSLRRIFLDFESSLADAFRTAYRDGRAASLITGPNDEDGFVALALLLMDGLFLQRAHYSHELFSERFDAAWRHLVALMSVRED